MGTSEVKTVAKTVFLTIATRSHLVPALASMRSIGSDPRWRRRIVLLDCATAEGAIDVEGISTDGLSESVLTRLREETCADYEIPELCFVLKPVLIGEALAAGIASCAYLDSDIHFFSDPSAVVDDALGHSICLTPHYLKPRDFDTKPNPLTLLRAGVFNAGFVSVSACDEGRAFVDWWWAAARHHGYNLPKRGMCCDQRWLDLVPVLFPGTHVIRRSGVNVGYWNAHERELCGGDKLPVRTSAGLLEFYHFSGFDPAEPTRMSRFGPKRVEPSAAMKQLLDDYLRALRSATTVARSLNAILLESDALRLIRQRRWRRLARRIVGRPVG